MTLSTTGYGDLSPVTDVGQMLAVIEALIGQIYRARLLLRGCALLASAPGSSATAGCADITRCG